MSSPRGSIGDFPRTSRFYGLTKTTSVEDSRLQISGMTLLIQEDL